MGRGIAFPRSRRLAEEKAALRAQLNEAEQLLNAIRYGTVDTIIVQSPNGPQVYTLQSVEGIYRVLVETMNEGAAILHPSGTILYANRHLLSLLDLPLEQLIGLPFRQFIAPDQAEAMHQLLAAGIKGPIAGDSTLQLRNDQRIPVRISMHPLTDEVSPGVCTIITDLTEHERARAILQAALEQKDVLLREIHHRVKNNLQVITSMLRLQASSLADPQVSSAFQDSLNRIRAMALVHEQLYSSANLTCIEAKAYLQTLAKSLLRSSATFGVQKLVCLVEPAIWLPIDIAVPLGLITSELIANSLKHGLAGVAYGEIRVALRNVPEGLSLGVHDNGIGLPEGFDPACNTTLGLRIVHTLARQLGGELRIHSDDGTLIEVIFPAPQGDFFACK
ncbi:MAG: PAS domain-containing protein [Candidatus Viridilinea halotolerans]|uniref:histidine kinase n=1 Tax=Candidatus Viridilinea halotolerans TaxID=2491704 RepID=A0A426U9X6_9CHLR|nr:MAG: PAS domain-containing protein [Candidatus Viridilinea halotolerans]